MGTDILKTLLGAPPQRQLQNFRQKTSHFSTKNHVQTYWRSTSSMKTWFNHTQWTWVDELLQGTTCMEYSPLLMLRWLTCSRELVQHPWHGCAFWELKLHADVAMTRWYQHNCFPERWRAKLACVFVACLRGKNDFGCATEWGFSSMSWWPAWHLHLHMV